ncbi:hypothetical protein IIA15_08955 [candidate division TA06 bacterium]|nr:hypothetical protein [candidate division TA06 bacterium]
MGFLVGDTLGSGWVGKFGLGLTDYDKIGTNLSYLASLEIEPTQTSHLTLRYEHDNVVYKVNSLKALKEGIDFDEFVPSFYQWIADRWSFWGRLNIARYSDHNLKTSLEASLTYLMRTEPAYSLTYAFGYLDYKERSDLYWDPTDLLSHYLIFGMEESFKDLLSIYLRSSIGFSPSEKRANSGLLIRLTLHKFPRWGLGVTGDFLRDGGRGENYSYATSSINIIYLP